MDGVQLLAKVKVLSPDTVRVMLTGNAEIQTAVSAVNEGSIFRFLTKPCTKETLARALSASLMQARLITAERELLEKTLKGSIRVLAEILSLVNPAAFSRGMRLRRYIQHIAEGLALSNPWRFEVAAMMSQLGCVILAPETIDAVYRGQKLSPEEQERYDVHPQVARDLLSTIPRMEPIAWMIAHQTRIPELEGDLDDREMADMRQGAEILHVAMQYDELLLRLGSKTEALHRLAFHHKTLDPRILQALLDFEPKPEDEATRTCMIQDLSAGMLLADEIRTNAGTLVAEKGHEVTVPLILKLQNLERAGGIGSETTVSLPKPAAAAAGI